MSVHKPMQGSTLPMHWYHKYIQIYFTIITYLWNCAQPSLGELVAHTEFVLQLEYNSVQDKWRRALLYQMCVHERSKGSLTKPQLNSAKLGGVKKKKNFTHTPPLSSCLEKTRWQ